jgi:hypothetical protein
MRGNTRPVRILFSAAAIYDGVLGIGFLLFQEEIFRVFAVAPPNHMGYVQFPAAVILVFALMFIAVARRPHTNRNLIPYSILFKLAYSGVVFWHWAFGAVPSLWKPFAVADLLFAALFAWAYAALGKDRKPV